MATTFGEEEEEEEGWLTAESSALGCCTVVAGADDGPVKCAPMQSCTWASRAVSDPSSPRAGNSLPHTGHSSSSEISRRLTLEGGGPEVKGIEGSGGRGPLILSGVN